MRRGGAVAVIGGGFSGSLLAYHLLKRGATVHIFETRPELGRGVAYGTQDLRHLLNVPAGKMSAFRSEPGHFVEWLVAHGHDASPAGFMPRKIYGDYVADLVRVAAAEAGSRFMHQQCAATYIEASGDGFTIRGDDAGLIQVDQVALTVGNLPPANPTQITDEVLHSGRYFSDPWDSHVLNAAGEAERVLLIGSGLTAIDICIAIAEKQPKHITVVSSNGRWPRIHDLSIPPHNYDEFMATWDSKLLSLFGHLMSLRGAGEPWRGVIDGLRPYSQRIWKSLSVEDRDKFMSRLRSVWETHRHRMAPEIAGRMAELESSGVVEVRAGRLVSLSNSKDGICAKWSTGEGEFDVVVNCTGPQANYRRADQPLLAHLFESGMAEVSLTGFGLRTDDDGTLLDAHGERVEGLYTMGPLRKGDLWETTAVPELRGQAEDLATTILG